RGGRIVVVLPWNELALVGTTDTDYGGDADHVVPNAADVAYLLDVVTVRSLRPGSRQTTSSARTRGCGLSSGIVAPTRGNRTSHANTPSSRTTTDSFRWPGAN